MRASLVAAIVLSSAPALAGAPRPTQLAIGAGHGCARMSDGTARCWGDNSEGELGAGDTEEHKKPVTPPVKDVVQIAAGEHLTCALRADHTVVCWGWNPYGAIGSGDTAAIVLAPVAVKDLTDAIAIAAGEDRACAVRADHTAVCWGRNDDKQLGDGTAAAHATPVAVKGLDHVVAIAIGSSTCARRDDGSVWCWGTNEKEVATAVPGVAHAIDVSVGGLTTCVALADGGAQCWGEDDSGQLARGDEHDGEEEIESIAPVAGLAHVTAIAAAGVHTCAIAGGRVVCWGGEQGNPDFPRACLKMTKHRSAGGSAAQWKYCAKPTPVSGLAKPSALAVSGEMSCALLASGAIRCWSGGARSSPL
jgi:alpha-tubulin suppressor-like RCC1 family protein